MRERDGGHCRYCGLGQLGQVAAFHIDHITPRSAGGEATLANLALQCPHCSLRKSDKQFATDPLTGLQCLLFHPLLDKWDEHFQIGEAAMIIGLSPCGRATVNALEMNHHLPRTARQMQAKMREVPFGTSAD